VTTDRPNKPKGRTASDARAYIDRAIETNRRHDANAAVPDNIYRNAVRQVSRAFRGVRDTS
jgi:hypothetical protein